jgi:hypothetical protein
MPLVAAFIRSSADWYRDFLDPKDLKEHDVSTKWIDENYWRRSFFIGYTDDQPVGTISHQTIGDHAYLGYIYLVTQFV